MKPNIIGHMVWLGQEADVVEVSCPLCGCDRVEPLEYTAGYECCRCEYRFKLDYEEGQL